MSKRLALLATAMIMLALPVSGCATADSTAPAPETPVDTAPSTVEAAQEPNFTLLVSDEQNDIDDFSELWVTISGIGFVPNDDEGIIVEYPVDGTISVNLVTLTGENAVELWQGYLDEGTYTKVFLYVDEVWGILLGDGEEDAIEIKLPSNKLQVNVPVTVEDSGNSSVEYVFDITVHKAGNSGTYILSPQLSECGAGVKYRLLEHTRDRIMTGKPEWAGKPVDAGRPAGADGDEEQGEGPQGKPEDAGKPDDGGLRTAANKPDWAGQPQMQSSTAQGKV